jgi:ABC-type amino acid transport substrate-binding protein/cell division septation protein DedD
MSDNQIEKSSTKEDASTQNGESSKGKSRNLWVIVIISVLCISLVCIGIFLYNWLQKDEPVAEDESWMRVQEAGVLKVATSADYPPFAYYDQDQNIDGFDPALIQEIGAKLGVQVEIADYAFEGLGATLNVDQADLSIAAISITPARAAQFDFSNIYYIGQDGILARTDSEIDTITNPGQMAGLRVGVQKFSVYESWAQDVLVANGIVSEDQLFAYAKPEHAVDDLKHHRLDLVIMDLQPATLALHDGALKMVGQGLNQQRLAIALPQGADALRGKINEALLALQNEGRVNQLVQDYLGLKPEDIIPPPTPEPTEAPCIDAMEFVDDLSYDDEDLTNYPKVDPGEAFQKGWRIKNTGTCTWNSTYFIKYVHGSDPAAQMGGQPTAIKGAVEPDETYDLFVDLVAPEVAGKYVGYWQMHTPENQAFGQSIWVAIQVRKTDSGEPTATVTPETTPTPTEEPTPAPTATEVPPEPTATEIPPTPTATEIPPTPTPTEEPGADLRDITWILEGFLADIEDEELTEPLEDVDVELIFEDEGILEGNAGCNTFSGRYVTNGVEILFKDILITNVLCNEPEGIMEQEDHLLFLLDRIEEYRINEDEQLEFIREVIEDDEPVDKVFLLFYDLSTEQR